MRAMSRRQRAFTLIELMIVIIILIVLALIVIPRILGAGRKARESNLRSQLQELRNAVGKFEADCGDQPARLEDLMERPAEGSRGGGGISLDAEAWQGPYLDAPNRELPKDPFTMKNDWDYDAETGHVASSSTLTALNGQHYSSW